MILFKRHNLNDLPSILGKWTKAITFEKIELINYGNNYDNSHHYFSYGYPKIVFFENREYIGFEKEGEIYLYELVSCVETDYGFLIKVVDLPSDNSSMGMLLSGNEFEYEIYTKET